MLTGAKQWGPLPVLEKGQEDTSNHQVSRDSVLICLFVYHLLVLVGLGTDSSHMWRSEDRQLVGGHTFYMCVLRFELGSPGLVAKAFSF